MYVAVVCSKHKMCNRNKRACSSLHSNAHRVLCLLRCLLNAGMCVCMLCVAQCELLCVCVHSLLKSRNDCVVHVTSNLSSTTLHSQPVLCETHKNCSSFDLAERQTPRSSMQFMFSCCLAQSCTSYLRREDILMLSYLTTYLYDLIAVRNSKLVVALTCMHG